VLGDLQERCVWVLLGQRDLSLAIKESFVVMCWLWSLARPAVKDADSFRRIHCIPFTATLRDSVGLFVHGYFATVLKIPVYIRSI
jgi:hypothetical protein